MEAPPPIQPLPDHGSVLTEPAPPAKLCFIDVETTGLDPERHQVYEIGAVVEEKEFHWWLQIDLAEADPTALRISGYYDRHPAAIDERYEPHHPREVAQHVAKLTSGAYLVGINPAFDATFLGAFMRRCSVAPAWHYHLIDCLPLIAGRYRIAPPWESRALSQAIHVDPPGHDDRHTALGDALWAKRMYEAVMSAGEE